MIGKWCVSIVGTTSVSATHLKLCENVLSLEEEERERIMMRVRNFRRLRPLVYTYIHTSTGLIHMYTNTHNDKKANIYIICTL